MTSRSFSVVGSTFCPTVGIDTQQLLRTKKRSAPHCSDRHLEKERKRKVLIMVIMVITVIVIMIVTMIIIIIIIITVMMIMIFSITAVTFQKNSV